MELDRLVRRAADRDVRAFVELTKHFQHFAFGSALALVGIFIVRKTWSRRPSSWPGGTFEPDGAHVIYCAPVQHRASPHYHDAPHLSLYATSLSGRRVNGPKCATGQPIGIMAKLSTSSGNLQRERSSPSHRI
jgi:hypothetical protein